jgi:hypothetical protein
MQSQPFPGYNHYNPQRTEAQISPQHNHPANPIEAGPIANGPNGPPQQYLGADSVNKKGKNKRKGKKRSKRTTNFVTIFIAITLASLISSGSTFFLMGGSLFNTPSEYEGKWYSGISSGHLNLLEDGTLKYWDEARFPCFSGETVRASWVNDGDDDCLDGSDEDTNRANTFNPEYGWQDYVNSDRYITSEAYWSVDGEMFCLEVTSSYPSVYSEETKICYKSVVERNALWIGSDEIDEAGEIEECEVMLKLTNRESGPQEWSQNWVDAWNFALEDVYSERPSFCQSTTFDSLQQEFYSF